VTFFVEVRVAWGLKHKVLVPINPFQNIFVFGLARGGLGPKTIRGNKFYKGHRDIAEKPHITLKKPQFHLKCI
jgi:hypothetical protein